MKRLKTISSIALAGVFAFTLTACGSDADTGNAAAGSGDGSSIGILQLTQHPALDETNEGFIDALDDAGIDYTVDQQNASNDQSACQTIASKFVSDGDDLIFAIGTPAAQAAAGATSDIPVVGSAITDFAEAGLAETNDAPGRNVTGTSDLTPVADQIDLLTRLVPSAKTVGILYSSAEANSEVQVKLAEEALDAAGLAHERYSVSSTNEVNQVVESMAGKVDAIYVPTDNTIAGTMANVSDIATQNGIPVIVGCDTMVEDGGLASYSINYEDLGYKAGQMAVEILNGEAEPADMPIEYLSDAECELVVNTDIAQKLGIDLSVLSGEDYEEVD